MMTQAEKEGNKEDRGERREGTDLELIERLASCAILVQFV